MLRMFSGLCRFRERARELIIPPRLLAYCRLFLSAAVVLAVAGCSTQQYNLAEHTKSVKDQGMDLVTSTSLSSASSAAAAAPADLQSDTERPNVSRLQKQESGEPKLPDNRSSLDLTTYQSSTPSNGEVPRASAPP